MKPNNSVAIFPSSKTVFLETNAYVLLQRVANDQERQRQRIEMLEAENKELRRELLELKTKWQLLDAPEQAA